MSSFDPCADSDVLDLVGPVSAETWGQDRVLLADAEGYVLFWGNQYSPNAEGLSGVWAVRPGSPPARLTGAVDAQFLSVVALEPGFLACWHSDRLSFDPPEPRAGACLTIGSDLAPVDASTRPDFGVVSAVGRTDSGLIAIGLEDETAAPLLFAIDDTGAPTANPIPSPCGDAAVAWSSTGFACLEPSDPLCGTQFDEPSDCVYDLHSYDSLGAPLLIVPSVAPYGSYAAWLDVELAGLAGAYFASWTTGGRWHGQLIEPDGGLGASASFQDPSALAVSNVAAVDNGYVAIWSSINEGYVLPRLIRIAPDGSASDPEWLTDPEGPLTRHSAAGAAITSAAGSIGIAWEAAGGTDATDYIASLRFRSMGCDAP